MENQTVDLDALLNELNDEKVIQMIPVIVYMAVLMIVGLLGNAMVCYYYGFKTRRTSNTLFIIGLAIFDLITCTVTIPLEIYDLRYFYMFYNVSACKCMRFVNHFASVSSITVLLAIAIDRYKRICRPFKKQYNLTDAVRALVISIAFSIFLSWPASLLYIPVKVLVNNDRNITLYGSDCTLTRSSSFRVFMWVFNSVYLFLFFGSVVLLCVLYCLMGRVLFRHSQIRKRYSRPIAAGISPGQNDSNGADTSFTKGEETNASTDDPRSVYSFKARGKYIVDTTTGTKPGLKAENKASANQIDTKTIKYTTIMLSITVTFIISCLPYLVLSIWRVFIGAYEVNILSDTELVLFQIGLRSYFLNSAINPFLYGFFNSKFRRFFYGLFCPCCAQEPGDTTTTSSSEGHSRN